MKIKRFFVGLMVLIGLAAALTTRLDAQEGDWGFGADLGVLTGTVEGGEFALGVSADRYLHRQASIGAFGFVTPGSDLFSIAGAGVLKFHIETPHATVSPFVGVGAIYEDAEREENNVTISDDDTSYYVPLGVSVERPFSDNLTGGVKLILNLHDLEFKQPFGDDSRSAYLTGTINFRP